MIAQRLLPQRVIPNRADGEGSHQRCWIAKGGWAPEWPFVRSFACAQDDRASVADRSYDPTRREHRLGQLCNADTSLP